MDEPIHHLVTVKGIRGSDEAAARTRVQNELPRGAGYRLEVIAED
jgi:hypothetical protein